MIGEKEHCQIRCLLLTEPKGLIAQVSLMLVRNFGNQTGMPSTESKGE